MNTEIRCAVELRDDADRGGPGMLSGVLMRYGDSGQHGREVFRAGALSWPDGGVVLNEQHNRQAPIVRFVPTVDGDEVRIDVPLPDTQRGRDAAVMVRNGTMRGVSVEFRAQRAGMVSGRREIAAALLVRAGLVDDPSYGDSTVEVRAGDADAPLPRVWL